MRQLTEDHPVVAQLLKTGQLTPTQARHHYLRHFITRSLGNSDAVADCQCVTWAPGAYLLLCSDGLTNMVEDAQIRKLILRGRDNVQATCDRLVDLPKTKGGKDNITLILAYRDDGSCTRILRGIP